MLGKWSYPLCCHLLSLQPELHKIGTRDLAGLLVFWMEAGKVPADMAHTVYDGMEADLRSRNQHNHTVS